LGWAWVYRSLESLSTDELVRDQSVADIIASRRILRIKAGKLVLYLVGVGSHIHMVLPRTYCSCVDFTLNVAIRRSRPFCVHLAAVELIERKKIYREIFLGANEASKVVSSVLEGETTPYLSI
jgi:predicted nucleic acid-binding Zn finger protein